MNKFSLILVLAFFVHSAWSNEELPPMDNPDFDEFYLASSFTIPKGKSVYVTDVAVEFEYDWLQEYRARTTPHYKNRIKKKYGETMREQLIVALKNSGWDVKKEKTADAIVLNPKLVELNIYAPNEPGIRQVIIRNAGHAKLVLTFETPDGSPFMKIVDKSMTRESVGSPIVANRANNHRYFKLLMEHWSGKSVKYLDEIYKLVQIQVNSH